MKKFGQVLMGAFLALACLFLLSVLFFSAFYLVESSIKGDFFDFVRLAFLKPITVWTAYENFFERLLFERFRPLFIIPLLAPVIFVVITVLAYVRTPYSFKLWYKIHSHFASEREVEKIGLFDGFIGVLGHLLQKAISLNNFFSILVYGEKGLGKTTAVAIPSILESDDLSIVAADCNGDLAKYTAGYRRRIGNMFYLNWDVLDVKKNAFSFARWNPLSPCNLPPRGVKRDEYVFSLIKSLFPMKEDYWSKMLFMAIDGLFNCFIEKIEQACANDYFLKKLLEDGRLSLDDKKVLLSYYEMMPAKYSASAIKNVKEGKLNIDNYLPVGSWFGVPGEWCGRELSLPFCADCLTKLFFINATDEKRDEWKIAIGGFIKEAKLFGYNKRSKEILEFLFYISRKQRDIIFAMAMEPLEIFRKKTVRERMLCSDFSNKDIRRKKMTIYLVAESRSARIMTRLFLNLVIEENKKLEADEFPMLYVLDDFSMLDKIDALNDGLLTGYENKTSFMLLTDSLESLSDKYGVEGLENIISSASYKLVFASDNVKLSNQFSDLAKYGEKSVQIPHEGSKIFSALKKGIADSDYYRRIAKSLLIKSNGKTVEKGQNILLAEGYYHMPIKTELLYFMLFEELNEKALIEPDYILSLKLLNERNVQDLEPVELYAVLKEAGVKIKREEDIEKFIRKQSQKNIFDANEKKDKMDVLTDDISSRWAPVKITKKMVLKDDKEWWMEEESFKYIENEGSMNPFKN